MIDPVTVSIASMLVSKASDIVTEDLARRLRDRAQKSDSAQVKVDEVVDRVGKTGEAIAAVERGDLQGELLDAVQTERTANRELILTMRELIEKLEAEHAEEQTQAVKHERRAKLGTAIGVTGTLVGIASLVVAIIAL